MESGCSRIDSTTAPIERPLGTYSDSSAARVAADGGLATK